MSNDLAPVSVMSPSVRSASLADVRQAIRNALTLGASLMATWSVALVVRFFLPRHLGPEQFGIWNFVDGFSATFFVALGLGVDTYIQKEIPLRPKHVSDFFGGVTVLRMIMSVGLFAAMIGTMLVAHRPPEVVKLAIVLGANQVLTAQNSNLASMLHASSTVRELAVVNVAAKILWGLFAALIIIFGGDLRELALAVLFTEAVRSCALLVLTRRYLSMRLSVDARAVRTVILASLPFYVNQMANTLYAKIDVNLLTMLSNDREVGWYGSASNLAGLSFLISPLLGWVLLPLLSRASAISEQAMFRILRHSLHAILMLVLPASLMVGLSADILVPLAFGHAFTPAVMALRVLAPLFALTYVAMVASMTLVIRGRSWTVTLISLGGLVISPVLSYLLVPRGLRWVDQGGAGAGAAAALVITELCVVVALLFALGKRIFDRTSAVSLGKTSGICVIIALADVCLLRPLGPVRIAVDVALYVALVFALGAARKEDIQQLVGFVRERHRPHAIR